MIKSHFVGAILEDCSLPLPNHGHVILAQPSPVLLYQIGTHDTRVLVDVPGKVPSAGTGALKEHMLKYVMPQLPTAVQPSFAKAIKDQRLRVMPNSFLPAVRNDRPGFILVGDALNMRHPLTGGKVQFFESI
jgi:squalene monooxygenase